MKAVIFDKHAAPDVLVFREVEKPVPNDNEVLVRIFDASVNALDYRSIRMGIIPKKRIFGADIAGIVETVGCNVHMFKPGDEVIGDVSNCGLGGFAEYVTVPERALVPKPADISFEQAAALPVAAITALQALRNKGGIRPGQKVLVCGASGGVGTYALQLAKIFGADVTAVCSTKNVQQAYTLGADHVIDYKHENFTKNASRYDLIAAVNGSYPLFAYKRVLEPGGILVILGGPLYQILKAAVIGPFMSAGSRKIRLLAAKPNPADLELLVGFVKDGRLKPVIDRRYPLSDTAEAVRYLEKEHSGGKIVITVI